MHAPIRFAVLSCRSRVSDRACSRHLKCPIEWQDTDPAFGTGILKSMTRSSLQQLRGTNVANAVDHYGGVICRCPGDGELATMLMPRRAIWIAWMLCGVFIASAIGKVLSPHSSVGVLRATLGVGRDGAAWLTDALVLSEFLIGAWLVMAIESRVRLRAALSLVVAFLVLVTIGVLWLMVIGSPLSCGCGLPKFSDDPCAGQSIAWSRNLGLFGLAVVAWIATSSRREWSTQGASL